MAELALPLAFGSPDCVRERCSLEVVFVIREELLKIAAVEAAGEKSRIRAKEQHLFDKNK